MSEMKHSPIGASSAERWMNCPGSVTLAQQVQEKETESEYAKEGTAAHELAENCLIMGVAPSVFLGNAMSNGVLVDQEMVDVIAPYISTIHCHQRIVNKPDTALGELHVEKSFHLDWLHPMLFGTNDACIVGKENIYVDDLKYGKGKKVYAENNTQCKYYGLGAMSLCPNPVKTVTLGIVQKRYRGKAPVDLWEISGAELLDWGYTKLKPAAEKAMSGSMEFQRGGWCQFCKGRALCPEVRNEAASAVKVAFDPITKPTPTEIVLPDATQMTAEQLTYLRGFCDVVEPWFKSVRSYVKKKALDEPGFFPDLKIIKGRKTRKWENNEAAETEMKLILGDKVYESKLKSVAKMEEACKETGINLPDHLVNVTHGTSLVSADDPHETYVPNSELFTSLKEENVENV